MRQCSAGSEDIRVQFQHSDVILPSQRRRGQTGQVLQRYLHILRRQVIRCCANMLRIASTFYRCKTASSIPFQILLISNAKMTSNCTVLHLNFRHFPRRLQTSKVEGDADIQQSAMQMNGCRHLVPLYPYHATNYSYYSNNFQLCTLICLRFQSSLQSSQT